MKIVFEGHNVMDVADQMALFLTQFGFAITGFTETAKSIAQEVEDEEILEKAAGGTGEPAAETSDQPSLKADPKKKPKSIAKKAKPAPEPEPEPETEEEAPAEKSDDADKVSEKTEESDLDPAVAKQRAIDILMEKYNDGKAKQVKDLLSDFGVKKFGELPEEKGNELLKAAEAL